MRTESPPPSLKLVVLAILGGSGLGLAIVGVTTTFGWRLLVPGLVVLLVCLGWMWVIVKTRDRALR